jgi:hypothetical protein
MHTQYEQKRPVEFPNPYFTRGELAAIEFSIAWNPQLFTGNGRAGSMNALSGSGIVWAQRDR